MILYKYIRNMEVPEPIRLTRRVVLGRREARFQIAPGTRSLLSVAVKAACVTEAGPRQPASHPGREVAVEEKAKGTSLSS